MDLSVISYRTIKQGPRPAISMKTLIRIVLWKEQAGLCHYCDQPTILDTTGYPSMMATIEHLCPRSQGGPNHIRNFVMSCQGCNNRRSSQGYEAFCLAMGLDMSQGRRRLALKREQTYRRKWIKRLHREGKLHRLRG